MLEKLRGTGVALITPFRKDGSIDLKCLEKLIESLIKGKVNYFVILGTTGESSTLTEEEKVAVFEFVIEVNNKRLPLVAGVGGNNTQEIINFITNFHFEGIDAVLSVCPYYNKPSQEGIYQHYKAIAGASSLPIILYNIPGRAGVNITADTTLRLARDFKNIIGIKEASGNFEQCMEIINNRPKNFLMLSGDDVITLPLLACGADGVISVVANAYPRTFSNMVSLALEGNFDKARKLHYKILNIMKLLFVEGNPAGIKAALKAQNICQEIVRLPLYNVSKTTYNALASEIESF